MGLLNTLFGFGRNRSSNAGTDHVWMTTEAKFEGIAQQVVDRIEQDPSAIILLAHFADVLDRMSDVAARHDGTVPVRALPADSLSEDRSMGIALDEAARIEIIVGERHPIRSADARLEQFASKLPCQVRLSYHVSLEDPLMTSFMGAEVRGVLTALGMTEGESVENPMVSRQIKLAQREIEQRAHWNHAASSAEEWLEKNHAGF